MFHNFTEKESNSFQNLEQTKMFFSNGLNTTKIISQSGDFLVDFDADFLFLNFGIAKNIIKIKRD
jgi:hypothetical protein